jgi:hypothetical protein
MSAKVVSCSNINGYLRNYQDCLTLLNYRKKFDITPTLVISVQQSIGRRKKYIYFDDLLAHLVV